jgi:hypothetical protein
MNISPTVYIGLLSYDIKVDQHCLTAAANQITECTLIDLLIVFNSMQFREYFSNIAVIDYL